MQQSDLDHLVKREKSAPKKSEKMKPGLNTEPMSMPANVNYRNPSIFFGEFLDSNSSGNGRRAISLAESLASILLFAHAINLDPLITLGETSVFDLEKRVWAALLKRRCFLLDPTTGYLCKYTLSLTIQEFRKYANLFEEDWTFWTNEKEPITTELLSEAQSLISSNVTS